MINNGLCPHTDPDPCFFNAHLKKISVSNPYRFDADPDLLLG